MPDANDDCRLTPNAGQPDGDGVDDVCDPPGDRPQCKTGRWRHFTFTRTFRDQGDCIQSVNTGQ